MKPYTKPLFSARTQSCRMAVLALALSGVGLTGCSDTPHDRVDALPPAKMTTLPEPAKTTADAKPTSPAIAIPTESELGLPIYPGVKIYTDATGMAVKPLTDSSMATAVLETSDPLDKVVDFYKERIKQSDARGNATPATPREEKADGKRKVILTGNDTQGNVQLVQAREETGKTVIELMRTSVKSLPSGVADHK